MKTLTLLLTLLLALSLAAVAQDVNPTNIYAAGVSFNQAATPQIAGTGLYARKAGDIGTYAFTAVDVLPTTIRPLVVTTQFSAGVAQRVLTIGGVRIYIPTSAGISYNGTNTGWAWTTGGLAAVKLKGAWEIMPNARLVKSSVSNGTGYQVIFGVLFGYAK